MKNIKNGIQWRNIKLLLIALPFFLIFAVFNTKYGRIQSEKEGEYIRSIGLNLQGKVIEKAEFNAGHNYGVIYLELYQSNIKLFDDRDNQEKHIGLIKNDKAEIIFNAMSQIKIGDSISIENDQYHIYRMGKLIYNWPLSLGGDSMYRQYERELRKIEM